MRHQHTAVRLAPSRLQTESFEQGLAHVARRLLFSALNVSDSDRQFLHDVARSEARYPMKGLRRLIAISQRSIKPDDREALAELIRREILVGLPPMELTAAFDLETETTAAANMPQRLVERNPDCPAARARAIDSLTAQLVATRHAIVAVAAA